MSSSLPRTFCEPELLAVLGPNDVAPGPTDNGALLHALLRGTQEWISVTYVTPSRLPCLPIERMAYLSGEVRIPPRAIYG